MFPYKCNCPLETTLPALLSSLSLLTFLWRGCGRIWVENLIPVCDEVSKFDWRGGNKWWIRLKSFCSFPRNFSCPLPSKESKKIRYLVNALHYALCSYPNVKVSIRDMSQVFTTAPIFEQSHYFRQNIWVVIWVQFHFQYIFQDDLP